MNKAQQEQADLDLLDGGDAILEEDGWVVEMQYDGNIDRYTWTVKQPSGRVRASGSSTPGDTIENDDQVAEREWLRAVAMLRFYRKRAQEAPRELEAALETENEDEDAQD